MFFFQLDPILAYVKNREFVLFAKNFIFFRCTTDEGLNKSFLKQVVLFLLQLSVQKWKNYFFYSKFLLKTLNHH